MVTRRCRIVWLAIALAATLGFPSAAGAAKPIMIKQAAKQYLADVGPYNAAASKCNAAFDKWAKEANPIPSQTTVFVNPMDAAMNTFDNKLLSQRWPTKAQGAIRTLYSDLATAEGDFESLPSIDILNESQWVATSERDTTILASAVNIVRHDLGLPLVTT